MSRQHHYLKIETEYYQAHEKGIKNFELRENNRNYRIGDIIHLRETVNGIETGRKLCQKEIIYILHGGSYGLDKNFCILQLKEQISYHNVEEFYKENKV